MNKLLIIDDEEANVRVLSISLKSDGYDVVTAFSGEEGIQVFEKESPDIVLTDIKMPGMDGIEVLKNIKSREPDAEVIIITGHGDIDNAIEALKYGASDFINKPIRDEALSIALKRAFEKKEIRRKLRDYTISLEKEVEIATRDLKRHSNFQSKLIRSSNDGIVASDMNDSVVIFNSAAERIFGYRHTEVIGKMNIFDLFQDDISNRFKESQHHDKSKADIPWTEAAIQAKNGSQIPVRFSGTLLYEKQEIMGSVAFFQDLREIRRLEKELVQSERLAAVGQTVAGLAHCIKNILHGFKGGMYVVDIGLEKNKTDKLKSGWDVIKRNIARTSDLVMDLLSYSKQWQPEYEPCNPNTIARDICDLLEDHAEEHHVAIVRDFDSAMEEVLIDTQSVYRILLNLMTNAIDACLFDEDIRKNFQVCLRTSQKSDKMIRFDIIDNGIGMTREIRDKLFTSFFSTKGHRGTGLGLLVVGKLIDEQGGSIEVRSQLSEGTTFSVWMPCKPIDDND